MFKLCLSFLLIVFLSTNLIVSQKSKNSKSIITSKSSKGLTKREVPFIQKFYTKTLGQIRIDKVKGRLPIKGSILECVVKCSATHGCHCVRVNIETNECNAFVMNVDDPNEERNPSVLDKYVYFTNNKRDEGTGVNLAIGKKVIQSSTYNQFKAQKAFDNNIHTESKTTGGKNQKGSTLPWILVDMKDSHVITGVMLLTKNSEAFHDFEIRVGNKPIPKSEIVSHFKENPICFGFEGNHYLDRDRPRVVKCEPCPLMGRYVSLQIVKNCTDCSDPGNNDLNLSEMEIYGYIP